MGFEDLPNFLKPAVDFCDTLPSSTREEREQGKRAHIAAVSAQSLKDDQFIRREFVHNEAVMYDWIWQAS